jgi:hypothetical protein
MATMSFVVLNQCSEGSNLLKLTAQAMNLLTDTLKEYAGKVAQFYGGTYEVRLGSSSTDRKAGEIAIHLDDKTPEAPDAVAYHQVVNGIPDIVIGMDNVDTISQGSDSLTCAATHELGETIGDPGCNRYEEIASTDAVRRLRAFELCDRVQNIVWQADTGADVSDFLLPSAYFPGSAGPWDYASLISGKSLMADENDYTSGYDVEAVISGEHQLFQDGNVNKNGTHAKRSAHLHNGGVLSVKALLRKAGCFSRARRRGVEVFS